MKPKAAESNAGPFAYVNWKGMEEGRSSDGAAEFPLYTDAHITGNISQGYGPYQFLNTGSYSPDTRLKPAIMLRVEDHMPDSQPLSPDMKTDTKRYHGGDIKDEIAALISLCLGIRLESGGCTRIFESKPIKAKPDWDVRGRPTTREGSDAPVMPPMRDSPVLPYALGHHSLQDTALLSMMMHLTPRQAIALVGAARLYQNAMWIGESQPELSWLMFVSAVEVAAGQWRQGEYTPLERMQASRPELIALLTPFGDDLVQQVAKQIAPFMGASLGFRSFLLTFLPAPPTSRPNAHDQHPWDNTTFEKSFKLIYTYRSDALHGGIPFPYPMCRPPRYDITEVCPEKPAGLNSRTKGAVWSAKDTPMLLHLFEYIVRKSLLAWWQEMVDEPVASNG